MSWHKFYVFWPSPQQRVYREVLDGIQKIFKSGDSNIVLISVEVDADTPPEFGDINVVDKGTKIDDDLNDRPSLDIGNKPASKT